jgi:hypothetical protein
MLHSLFKNEQFGSKAEFSVFKPLIRYILTYICAVWLDVPYDTFRQVRIELSAQQVASRKTLDLVIKTGVSKVHEEENR